MRSARGDMTQRALAREREAPLAEVPEKEDAAVVSPNPKPALYAAETPTLTLTGGESVDAGADGTTAADGGIAKRARGENNPLSARFYRSA